MTKSTRWEQARINGKLSRGPVTAKGKARSAKNATRHGAYARPDIDAVHTALLNNEDRAGFADLLARRAQDLRPANSFEIDLVRELCDIEWRMDRYKAIETRSLNLQLLIAAEADHKPGARKKALPIDYTCSAYSDLLATSDVLQFCACEFRHLQKARTETLNTFLRLRKQPKFFAQSKEPATFQQLDNWNEPEGLDPIPPLGEDSPPAIPGPEVEPAPVGPPNSSPAPEPPAQPQDAPVAPEPNAASQEAVSSADPAAWPSDNPTLQPEFDSDPDRDDDPGLNDELDLDDWERRPAA